MRRLTIPIAALLVIATAPLVANADLREQYKSNGECSKIYRSAEKKEVAGTYSYYGRYWINKPYSYYAYYCTHNGNVYDLSEEKVSNGSYLKRSKKMGALGVVQGAELLGFYELQQWFVEGSDLVYYFCSVSRGSTECSGNVKEIRYILMPDQMINRNFSPN
jgi:hypothetical protein